MSATLQIIAVMKTLGVITLKDHSLAPVSQGTKAMETIVPVSYTHLTLPTIYSV